jgi:hypothetical protein
MTDEFSRIGPSPERLQYLDALAEIERLRTALKRIAFGDHPRYWAEDEARCPPPGACPGTGGRAMTPEAAMRLFNWAMAAVKNDPSATVDILVEKVVDAQAKAEATRAALSALRERVKGLYSDEPDYLDTEFWVDGEPYIRAAAVLALIAEAQKEMG